MLHLSLPDLLLNRAIPLAMAFFVAHRAILLAILLAICGT